MRSRNIATAARHTSTSYLPAHEYWSLRPWPVAIKFKAGIDTPNPGKKRAMQAKGNAEHRLLLQRQHPTGLHLPSKQRLHEQDTLYVQCPHAGTICSCAPSPRAHILQTERTSCTTAKLNSMAIILRQRIQPPRYCHKTTYYIYFATHSSCMHT